MTWQGELSWLVMARQRCGSLGSMWKGKREQRGTWLLGEALVSMCQSVTITYLQPSHLCVKQLILGESLLLSLKKDL